MSDQNKVDVFGALDEAADRLNAECPILAQELRDSVEVIHAMHKALKAHDVWYYESRSARVTGESIYSYDDLSRMAKDAAAAGYAALARIGGES